MGHNPDKVRALISLIKASLSTSKPQPLAALFGITISWVKISGRSSQSMMKFILRLSYTMFSCTMIFTFQPNLGDFQNSMEEGTQEQGRDPTLTVRKHWWKPQWIYCPRDPIRQFWYVSKNTQRKGVYLSSYCWCFLHIYPRKNLHNQLHGQLVCANYKPLLYKKWI